ncbi:MAG: nucleotidyl transferase AbiEii/AbiGii toxin family protein [Nitrospirota bacterium]
MFDKNILKVTKSEIDFYEGMLYPFQDEIFKLIQTDRFYLSGGTCLSRFYYNHRYSEDLDFFFDGFLYPKEEFEIVFREIINRISEKFKTEITVSGEYFKRGFIYKKDVALKVEFIYENYKNVGQRIKVNEVYIDSKENIATNKLTAVYDRKTIKDFIDLFYLMQDIEFEQATKWAEYKVVPLDYEGILITFAEHKLEGVALMKQDISLKDFNDFVVNLIQRMVAYAKKHG